MVVRINKIEDEKLADFLIMLSFILFFNDELVRNVVAKVFIILNLPGYLVCSFLVMYVPLLLGFFLKRNKLKIDMIVCILSIFMFFIFTYLIHPEYSSWFFHDEYSVYNRIFRLDKGIYAYVFIRAIENKEELLKAVEITAILRFFYYLSTFLTAQANGYWLENDSTGALVQMSYSLSYGYKMLFSSVVFMYLFTMKKKKIYLPLMLIAMITILLGGSRGPLIGIGVSVLFFVWQMFVNSPVYKKCLVMIVGIFSIISLITVGFDAVIKLVQQIATKFNISSRSIEMFLNGTISENNGRDTIYGLAIDMIKDNPFGYGMYGDRYVIGRYYYWGYCHNIFLELLIDFGIVIGSAFIVVIIWKSYKMLFACADETYKFLFFIYFVSSLQLILSSSFWYSPFFWAAIAVCINCSIAMRRRTN